MKIVVTGGHPSPALAVIEQLLKNKEHEIHFIGRRFVDSEEKATTYEYQQIEKLGISFYNLEAGKLNRSFTGQSWENLVRIIKGFWQSRKLLNKIQPDVVMSFGGYLALPVCYVAKYKGIPVLTHEQTIAPGLSNTLIAKIAERILLSFPETLKYFDVQRSRVVGNPIRKKALRKVEAPIKLPSKKPVLYVTGGSLGSHDINVHVENILTDLLKDFIVIHQTGNVKLFNDYERLKAIKKRGYFPVKHFSTEEVGWVFKTADVVVSRAGANTTFELIALKKPAVLIPLPWSGNDEQREHAKLLENAGAAEVFEQDGASEELLEKIQMVHENARIYKREYKTLSEYVKSDAAEVIVEEIESFE